MYVTVQWFLLALKIDMYFEFGAYALYVSYLEANDLYNYYTSYRNKFYTVTIMLILTIPSLALSRYAISKESKTMMVLFILFQVICIGCMGFIMDMSKGLLWSWYAFTGFCLAFIIAAVWTIALAIMCLLNFNKGLKEFVQWKPFSRKLLRGQSDIYNMNQADTFHGLEDQRADEPIDDE
ncbi:hypothetical protein EDC94DRAFT_690379, partial [Helicostylum pulchrum]